MKHILLLLTSSVVYIFSFGQTAEENYATASEFFLAKDFQNSLIHINKALEKDSSNADYLLLKGNAELQLEMFREAFNTFSYGIYLHPRDAFFYNQRGLILMQFQKGEEAIKDFTAALQFANTDTVKAALLLNMGSAKADIRDFEGAYNDFSEALKLDSLDVALLNNLATVCDEVGRGNETLGYLFKVLKADSTNIGAYVNIGFKYQEMGDHREAIRYLNKVLELSPEEPLAYSNRAYNFYKLGQLDAALDDINKSIELYPDNSYAYRTRALIFIAQKQKTKACADIKTAIEKGFTKMYGDEVEKLNIEHCVKTSPL